MKIYSLIAILCFPLAFFLKAQNITGKVIDSRTSEVLPFASVFLNNTTIGTVTDTNGEFNLTAIKAAGTYELVLSFVGYDTYKTKVVVGDGTLKMGSIKLIASEIQLSAVEVSSTRDKQWERKLKTFKKIFLGEDKLAASCNIINPWVIDFPTDDRGNKFIAKASAPIEIENKGLGYKVIYYLSDFWYDGNGYSPGVSGVITGNAWLTELNSADAREITKWETNRSISYHHSIQCLFKSIIEHRINGEGFNLYKEGRPFIRYDTTALVVPDTQRDFYKISLHGRVEVHHGKEISWIRLTENMVIVDKNGFPKNSTDVEVSGDMSTGRVARILPMDYKPESGPSREIYQPRNVNDSTQSLTRLDSLVKKADHYSENHPIEKVHIHFDKPYYVLGEEGWYKAYVVTGSDLNPTDISSILNLDWVDPSGKVISHQRLKIEKGSATGDFTIDATLREGTYTVRAYTKWMRNEDPELFYSKRIQVFNPMARQSVLRNDSDLSKIDLQFFPEGGTLVAEIKTQIAFKAIDVNGMGVEVNGKIIDEQNSPVTTFRSTHNGMGIFSFIPQARKSYRAVLQSGETYSLPLASSKGLVLAASNINANKIVVRIQSSKEHNPSVAYLIGHSHGSICYAALIEMDSTLNDITISKDELPEGVLRLTLFNNELIPQCERMLFIKKDGGMVVTMKSDKEQYAPRDSIILNFEVNDKEGNPAQTSLSVSVTDGGIISADKSSENIYTRLLLQSDIKGNVQNPGWYFESQSAEKTYALDLVMLTHGWSRYSWGKILNPEADSISFKPESGITIEGQILSNNKPVANTPFILTASRSKNDFSNIYESDSLGHFIVSGLDFSDSTMFSWHVMSGKTGMVQNVEIQLDTAQDIPPVTQYGALYQTRGESKDELSEKVIARFVKTGVWNPDKTIMLGEVVVKAQRTEIKAVNAHTIAAKPNAQDLKSRISTSTFVGRYATWLPFAILKEMPDRTQIWGSVRARGFTPFVIIVDGLRAETTGIGGDPNLILGAIPIEQIEQIHVSDTGVIIVWTKNITEQDGLGIIKQKVKGYEVAREFYHPKYGPLDISTTEADNRITLYWNANLQTSNEGTATAKFYNTDTTRKLLIVVEGIANGQAVSTVEVLGKD